MKKLGRKTIAAILAASMVFTSFAVSAFAQGTLDFTNAEKDQDTNVYFGGDIKYAVDETQTVSGTGSGNFTVGGYDGRDNFNGYLAIFNAKNDEKVTGFEMVDSVKSVLGYASVPGSYSFTLDLSGTRARTSTVSINTLSSGEYYFCWYVPEGEMQDGSSGIKSPERLFNNMKSETFTFVKKATYPLPVVSDTKVGEEYKITVGTLPSGTTGKVYLKGSQSAGPIDVISGPISTGKTAAKGDTVYAVLELFDGTHYVPRANAASEYDGNGVKGASVSPTFNVPSFAPTIEKIEGNAPIDGTFYAKAGKGTYAVTVSDTNPEPKPELYDE